MLTIPDTERLQFIVGKTSYDDLFKDIFHANDWYERMNAEIKQLTGDARKAATAEYIRRMEADIQFIIHHVAPKDADPNVTIYIYAETLAGNPVGRVIINGSTSIHPSIDIRLLREYRNQGYGYEMLRAIVDAIFGQLPIDHLEYDVLKSNEPSMRLIQKLGGHLVYGDNDGEMYELYPDEREATEQHDL